MNLSQSIKNDLLIVTPIGRLDSNTSPDLEKFFNEQHEVNLLGIILDMTQLDYISSAGLRVILNLSKRQKRNDKQFILCHLQDHIKEVFEISGFDLFVEIRPSLDEALNQPNQKR